MLLNPRRCLFHSTHGVAYLRFMSDAEGSMKKVIYDAMVAWGTVVLAVEVYSLLRKPCS